jgi:Fic family protein
MFKPRYRLTKYLSESLEQAAQLSSALRRLSLKSSASIKIAQDALSREVHSSTWIEGNTLSLEQVTAIVDGKDVDAELQQTTEVKNYYRVMQWVIKNKEHVLTASKILGLHAQVTKGLLASNNMGQWRKIQNYIVNARHQVIFTPPSPSIVPLRIKELLSWLSKSQEEHAIISSAIFHHEFLTIHPFVDGNGRMARALSQWILLKGGYVQAHALGLDEYFAADRAKYYQMINETHEMDGDYTYWIEYFAQGLLSSIKKLSERLRSVKAGREFTPKQRELLDLLKSQGILGSADICIAMKINRSRVNQLIVPLIAAGMVVKEGHTRSARYRVKQF